MTTFKGFSESEAPPIALPEAFFREILPQIDDLDELRIILYAFWRLDQLEGSIRYLPISAFVQEESFLHSFGKTEEKASRKLEGALAKAVKRGTLLKVRIDSESGHEELIFLNSPKGRAAVQAIEQGHWNPDTHAIDETILQEPLVNIFKLYETNIGPLTPMIAEALGDAEDTYPIEWIEDAIRIAVERNKRSWRYAEAILKRWQRDGRDVKKEKPEDQRDSAENRRRYIEGNLSDFIEH